MSVTPEMRHIKRVRTVLFILGCISFGYTFGWTIGVGIFCCAPAVLSAIKGKD